MKKKKTLLIGLSARVGSISDNYLGGWFSYRASKAALNSMTKSLANDFAKYNIRCNSLLLGYFKSKMTIKSFKNSKSRKARERHTVFQRWGKNKEVLGPVLFLSSDLSSYITGQNIVVDGGWTIKGFN